MNCLSTRRYTVFHVVLEIRETGNNPFVIEIEAGEQSVCFEWLIHVHRTKQWTKQVKTRSIFLTNVFWLFLVIDTKSAPELKLHEIVHPKKIPVSHRRGTENNQTERYAQEVSHMSQSPADKNEGLWGVV